MDVAVRRIGGRAPKVAALGDAGAVAERDPLERGSRKFCKHCSMARAVSKRRIAMNLLPFLATSPSPGVGGSGLTLQGLALEIL